MADTTFTIHTKNNGTINVEYITNTPLGINRGDNITINAEVDDIELIQRYIEYGGSYKTMEGLNGKLYYSDDVPSKSSIDSIVLGIEQNAELDNKNVFGIWGILNAASDNRPKAMTTNQVGLDMLVLAKYSDHADHSSLENDLLMEI